MDNNGDVYLVDPYDTERKRSKKMKDLVKDIANEIYTIASEDPYRYSLEDEVMRVADWIVDLMEDQRGEGKLIEESMKKIADLKSERDANKRALEDLIADKMGKTLKEKISKMITDLDAREKKVAEDEESLKDRAVTIVIKEKVSKDNIKEAEIKVAQTNHSLALLKKEEEDQKSLISKEIKKHRHYVAKIKDTLKTLEDLVAKYGELDGKINEMVDKMMMDHFE